MTADKQGKRIVTAVRLPVELHRRLIAVAAERDTSINHLMVTAAELYLDHLPLLGPAPAGYAPERQPPNERAPYLLDEVLKHGDENGALANATGDELRDALALAADRLRGSGQ